MSSSLKDRILKAAAWPDEQWQSESDGPIHSQNWYEGANYESVRTRKLIAALADCAEASTENKYGSNERTILKGELALAKVEAILSEMEGGK